MTKLEKQSVAQLRKAATRKKNRVCGTPSKMKKAELIHFLREGKGGGTKMAVGPSNKSMRTLYVSIKRGKKRRVQVRGWTPAPRRR